MSDIDTPGLAEKSTVPHPYTGGNAAANAADRRKAALAEIDEAKFSWFHAKACIVAGKSWHCAANDGAIPGQLHCPAPLPGLLACIHACMQTRCCARLPRDMLSYPCMWAPRQGSVAGACSMP